jgi:thiol-disulfide isomerase/thioredoxin
MENKKQNRWLSWLIYLVIFIVVVQGVNLWKTRNAQSGNLSDFNGVLMDGTSFKVAQYSGEPVLLHFWATWCPICEMEKDSIESISQDHPVISIASWSESESAVDAYMIENDLTFPVMLDNEGTLAQGFGVKGVPTSFILAPDGEITFVETGYSTETGLRLRLWLSTF